MRKVVSILCILLTFVGQSTFAAGDTFIDYQNYNHGYCPECNYYPCQCDTGYCPNATPCATCPNGTPPPYPLEPGSCPPQPSPCEEENNVCGISIYWIAIIVAAVATAAAIIVGADNGRNP